MLYTGWEWRDSPFPSAAGDPEGFHGILVRDFFLNMTKCFRLLFLVVCFRTLGHCVFSL